MPVTCQKGPSQPLGLAFLGTAASTVAALYALTCSQAKPGPSYSKGKMGGSHTGCAEPYSAQCGLQSLSQSHRIVSWNFLG